MNNLIPHQELTGIMHLSLEKILSNDKVEELTIEHHYQHTGTNALWNYSTIKTFEDEPINPAPDAVRKAITPLLKPLKMSLSTQQRSVLKILKQGGVIISFPQRGYKHRLLDHKRNPIKYVHGRTFNSLLYRSLIQKQKDGCFTSKK